jgi:serine/threonine protein kinase
VTTRWYRSPELILNLPYNETIDIYAFGSIIIELYLGYEAFSGKDAIDQLNKIFCVTGTPKSEEWPEGMKHLKEKMILFPNYKRANLKEYIPSVSDSGVNLIWKMV